MTSVVSICILLSSDNCSLSKPRPPSSTALKAVAVITTNNLNLRPSPSTSDPPLKQLKAGTTVVIMGHHGNWLHVSHHGDTGYIIDKRQYVYHIDTGGQSLQDLDLETLNQRKTHLAAEIEQQSAAAGRHRRREVKVIDQLDRIDRRLQHVQQQRSRLHTEIIRIEKRLRQTRTSIKALKQTSSENETYIGHRLTALYKLRRLGGIHLLASAHSLNDMLHRQTCIEHILNADLLYQQQLLAEKKQLKDLERRLDQQKGIRNQMAADYRNQVAAAATQKKKRLALLRDIRTEKTIRTAIVKQLETAAGQLDQTMDRLLKTPERASEEILKNSNRFSSYKGLLKMPVNGRIIAHFGPDKNRNNTVIFNSGIEIVAERGEPIHAVCDGIVQYSNWLKGYGNLIIIRHDSAYYTLYAHADELFKQQGDTVATGDVIATVGDTHSIKGPRLHFEVRHHSKALNPIEWLDNNG